MGLMSGLLAGLQNKRYQAVPLHALLSFKFVPGIHLVECVSTEGFYILYTNVYMSCILIKSVIFYAVDLLLIESTMDIVKKEVIHDTTHCSQSMHQKNSHLYNSDQ